MFRKNGVEKAVQEVQRHFSYLFDDGCQIVKKEYSAKNFGNWSVILHSEKCTVRISQDRGYIFVLLAPPWALTDREELSHYSDVRLLIAYLEKDELIDITADLQHIETQYEKRGKQLLQYYQRILELLNDPNYAAIEKELRLLNKRIFAKRHPGLSENKR